MKELLKKGIIFSFIFMGVSLLTVVSTAYTIFAV